MSAQPLTTDARDLTDLLATTRRQLRRTWLITGAALVLVASAGWLTLAACLDMILPMPVPMRVLAAVVFWSLLLGTLLAAVIWPVLRPMRDMRVARLIESVLPSMKNRLISSIDLHQRATRDPERGGSVNGVFYQRLLSDTRARLEAYRIDMVADPRHAKRSSLAAGAVLVLLIVLVAVFHEAMPSAIARVLRPTAPIPPVSHIRIAAPGDVTVLQGDPLTLTATLTRGDTDDMLLRLRTPGQAEAHYPMTRSVDAQGRTTFSFAFSRVQESSVYQLEGGGTWTAPARITALPRPVIEDVVASIAMPPYMGIDGLMPVPPEAAQIIVPEGGMIVLSAVVQHAPSKGRVTLLESVTQTREVTEERERVWIDDRLPADAEVFDDATWVSSPAYSGEASLLLDESHPRVAFHTRLDELVLSKDQSLALYLRAEAMSLPGEITVGVRVRGQKEDATWAIDPASRTPGQWVRVDRAAKDLGVTAFKGDTARIYGLWIKAAGGRVHVDRITSLQRTTTTKTDTVLNPLEELAMTREAQGPWIGRVPVARDMALTLTFANAHGHESLPMAPISVVAAKDQPPTVIVEKPGRSVTLDVVEPVPLVIRAMDDYGVDAVGVAYATAGDAFADPQWIREFEEPQQSQLAMTALNPADHGLTPDKPLRYRVAVRDRKGQIGYSPTLELRLKPPQGDARKTPPPVGSKLLEGLSKLLDVQAAIAQVPADLLSTLTLTPEGKLEVPPDASLDAQQVEQLKQLQGLLDQERKLLEALQRQFAEAAAKAEDSPLATTAEAQALDAMRQELAELARQDSPLSPEDAQALEQMGEQLEAMNAARDQWSQDADAAQQQMEDALARMQAQQAAQQLSRLDEAIAAQRAKLDEMAGQMGQLQREAMTAPTAQAMQDVSQQQAELDPQAMEAMRQAQQVAEAGQLQQAQAMQDAMPPAPWTPPGRQIEGMPVEQDTPEETPPAPAPAPGSETGPAGKQDDALAEQNWWDQPVDAPPESVTLQESERFADRQRPVEAPPPAPAAPGQAGDAPPQPEQTAENFQQELTQNSNDHRPAAPGAAAAPPTPRQLLVQHQGQMMQALQQSSQGLAQAQQQLGQLQQQMQGMAQPPGEAGQPAQPGQAAQAMGQAMASPQMAAAAAMAQAMAAAQQAQAAQAAQAGPPGQSPSLTPPQGPSLGPDSVQLRPGSLIVAELGDLPPDRRATLYRLPAEVRQPLIRGMTEKGPQGYQPLIDAYFRSLLDADSQNSETNAP